jgi:hypothetical protein
MALKSNRGGFMLLRHVVPWYCRAEKVQRYFLPSGVRVEPEQTVADSAALEGERKTVTALFADIKRSTELTRDLDPEEARAIPFFTPPLTIILSTFVRYLSAGTTWETAS